MALNPIVFTENVLRSFLRYQLTAYPFSDERLHSQMRALLSLDETRQSPLLKGPYISLSRPFRQGASVESLIKEGLLHPLMRQRIPMEITHLYGHQEEAIRSIHDGKTTLISTGTGSGKTECFLYPIVSKVLDLRDAGAMAGICAIIVYPMNALAEDQLGRLRGLLAGTGIPFGMYVGKTPERESAVAGIRMPPGSSRADYETRLAAIRQAKRSETVFPAEEVCSREAMRQPGRQPRILLTNVKQLELLLTRQRDIELFAGARLDFAVFDEAHTFTGAQGAETACLIRRLRAFCERKSTDTVCIATSATIVDKDDPSAARAFASRFFGVPAESVSTVGEAYEAEVWAPHRWDSGIELSNADVILDDCIKAIADEDGVNNVSSVRAAYSKLTSRQLPAGDWPEALYAELSHSEVTYKLNELLAVARPLNALREQLEREIGRSISEAEVLSWLTLAAAARRDSRPLLRPVAHVFVRGISGGVVSFPKGHDGPKLWLAAEDEIAAGDDRETYAHFPIATCTVCGQHYMFSSLKDFEFSGRHPGGGETLNGSTYWEPLDEGQGGRRTVLLDRVIGEDDDEDLDENKRLAHLRICRFCGAAHSAELAFVRCLHCGLEDSLVSLYAIKQNSDNPGYLSSCISCRSPGRPIGSKYREPSRPLRATNVADIHVLAQDMLHNAERQRLLVFCDNRQDAAFQAGWMKDHARRFRLRSLIVEALKLESLSIGDLVLAIDDVLEADETLSRALVPEVWQVVRKEGSGGRHERERRKYLRIQVLRELTLSTRQAIGLEPWGRIEVSYQGLQSEIEWISRTARSLSMSHANLLECVNNLLDVLRRQRVLNDPETLIYSKYWMDGDLEVQQGYLQQFGAPKGTKLRRLRSEKSAFVAQWLSDGGETPIMQMTKKWNIDVEKEEAFLEGLFETLVSLGILTPVRLKGSKGKPLPNVSEVYQVNSDRIRIASNRGVWRCKSCRRRTIRSTYLLKCLSWRCVGTLEFVDEDADNYDLQLLDQAYSMLRPEEHTAMVPTEQRERLENLFKGDSDAINAFVCTPTLELGVDIGQLDAILMRNVPPLPANYWQRAGRAGRRHRMAVNVTYCRPVSHDRAYFSDPLKMLDGRVDPPAFNLRNDIMVAKHVHAMVITRLHQYAREEARTDVERLRIAETLAQQLPDQISSYLFDDGVVRADAFDLAPLRSSIEENLEDLTQYVNSAFTQGWPAEDRSATLPDTLRSHIESMPNELDLIIKRLFRRLNWALAQIRRLHTLRTTHGALEPEDDALFRRCDVLIKRLKGTLGRTRREAEGYDDSNTFGVLAAEGFLPGYGLDVGSVLGSAEVPSWQAGAMTFTLPRSASVALREYVPGNLIYANGNKFVARRFHRDVDEERIEMPWFEISVERQALKETPMTSPSSSLGAVTLQTIAVCDVDLVHQSHISDEEDLRFQMGVTIFGLERDQHDGGEAYLWGTQAVHHRRGVRLRLVNIGASAAIERFERFGYPICTVCGQSVSPLSSNAQREHFETSHQERCSRPTASIGLFADVTADALSLVGCSDQKTAYSLLESLRIGAAQVLDMHVEDLQILVVGYVDREDVDALLWDPMPGGSGLIKQVCSRFNEVIERSLQVVQSCPSICEASCIDCLQTFRNSYYHKYLDRHVAASKLAAWGTSLEFLYSIPAKQPSKGLSQGSYPVNAAERRLRELLLRAGFDEGVRGERILLGRGVGSTTPDVIYRADHHSPEEGICIYLDGLSEHIHGNAVTAADDAVIRSWLRNHDFEVIEIAVSDLDDGEMMTRYFRRLANYLGNVEQRERLRRDLSWFANESGLTI